MKFNLNGVFLGTYFFCFISIIWAGLFPICILYFFILLFLIILLISYYLRSNFFNNYCKRKAKIEINKLEEIYSKEEIKDNVLNYLKKINPFVFNEVILYAFERNGYNLIRNKRYTTDGVINGRVIIQDNVCVIHSKRDCFTLEYSHIQEFNSILSIDKFKGLSSGVGIFIHTDKISQDVIEMFDNSNSIILYGKSLVDFICCPHKKELNILNE